MVQATRVLYPALPIAVLTPPPHRAALYPSQRFFDDSVRACHAWGRRENVTVIDVTDVCRRGLASGSHNPDGMHFGWDTHAEIGAMVAETLERASVP